MHIPARRPLGNLQSPAAAELSARSHARHARAAEPVEQRVAKPDEPIHWPKLPTWARVTLPEWAKVVPADSAEAAAPISTKTRIMGALCVAAATVPAFVLLGTTSDVKITAVKAWHYWGPESDNTSPAPPVASPQPKPSCTATTIIAPGPNSLTGKIITINPTVERLPTDRRYVLSIISSYEYARYMDDGKTIVTPVLHNGNQGMTQVKRAFAEAGSLEVELIPLDSNTFPDPLPQYFTTAQEAGKVTCSELSILE